MGGKGSPKKIALYDPEYPALINKAVYCKVLLNYNFRKIQSIPLRRHKFWKKYEV